MKSTRHAVLATLAGLPLLLPICSCSGGSEAKLNVILITLDTTRADFLGAWGRGGDATPHLDRLADEGIRFAMAISASAVTPVSHASILTGQPPYAHGLRILAGEAGFRLPEDVPTLSTTLKKRGYRTAAIHSALPVSAIYGFDNGYDVFEDVQGTGLEEHDEGNVGWDVRTGQRSSVDTTNLVLEFLEKTEEPFFLWIHYWDPHDGYLAPPLEYMRERVPFAADGKPIYGRDFYGAEVSFLDQQIGRLIDELKTSGRYDQTMLAVVSDHGEGLDDGVDRHGWYAHRILYQEQIHVPLILRIPDAPTGVVVENMVRSIDIFPTILEYLNIAPEESVEGQSLRPLIDGVADVKRIAYADQINLWDANAKMLKNRPQADFLHVAMDDRWKLIYRPSWPDQWELYDYRADPLEMNNLFDAEPEIATRLMEELAELGGWVLRPITGDGQGMSEHHLKMLEGLGYGGSEKLDPSVADGMWEWICPRDRQRHAEAGPCPRCQGNCLPVARPRK